MATKLAEDFAATLAPDVLASAKEEAVELATVDKPERFRCRPGTVACYIEMNAHTYYLDDSTGENLACYWPLNAITGTEPRNCGEGAVE